MDNSEVKSILQKIGDRVPPNSRLILIGGSALTLLGSPRLTIDIDFIGDDVKPNELHLLILQIARELKIHVEPVPLDRFIPLPKGSSERVIHIGTYGNLEIDVADPYSIALSKIDRGLDTDFDDIVFLIQNEYIDFRLLEQITKEAISQARQFDLHPEILEHFEELRRRIK